MMIHYYYALVEEDFPPESTDEYSDAAIYADQDGFVEPKPLHRKRRIEELCRGIGKHGYKTEWIDELYELLEEVD